MVDGSIFDQAAGLSKGGGSSQPPATGGNIFDQAAGLKAPTAQVKQTPQQQFNPVQAAGNVWNAVEGGYNNFFNSAPVKNVESTVSKAVSPVTNAIGGVFNTVVNTPLGKSGQSLADTYSQAMKDLGNGSVSYAPAKNNQPNNVKELTVQQSQENQTDPVRRYGQDVVDTLLSTMQGATGGIFKNPTTSINPEENIIKPIFQTAGQIYTIDKLGNVIGGILGKTPLATAVANNPSLSFIPKLVSNIGSFDIYGQLDSQVKDRVKQFVNDTQQGTLMTTLSAVGKVKFSVPLAFGGFFGLAKLNGASNRDALVSGIIGAALDGADKIPGLVASKFTSDFKNGSKEFTPQEVREFVVNSPFKDTPLGQDMMKQSFAAEEQGKNVQVDLGASKQGVLAKLFGKDKSLSGNTPEGIGYNVNVVDPSIPNKEGLSQGEQTTPEAQPVEQKQGTENTGASKETAITEKLPNESQTTTTQLPGAKTPFDTPEIIKQREAQNAIQQTHEINTPERQQFRQQLADTLYKNGGYFDASKRPTQEVKSERRADLVTGLPAAGKNTVLSDPLVKQHGSILIDADEGKLGIPESSGGKYNGAVHGEATMLHNALLEKAVGNGNNIVVPMVGRNTARFKDLVSELNRQGYEVHLHHNEVSVETSVKRAIQRYHDTGKFVDPDYIYNHLGLTVNKNYDINKTSPGISTYEKYSNEVKRGEKPVLIEHGENKPNERSGRSDRGINAANTKENANIQKTAGKPQVKESPLTNDIREALYSGDPEGAKALYDTYQSEGYTLPAFEKIQNEIEQLHNQSKVELQQIQKELATVKSNNPDDPNYQLQQIANKLVNHFNKPFAKLKVTGQERTYQSTATGNQMTVGGNAASAFDKLIHATDIVGFSKNIEILHNKFDKVFTEIYDSIKRGAIDGADYENFKKSFTEYQNGKSTGSTKSVSGKSQRAERGATIQNGVNEKSNTTTLTKDSNKTNENIETSKNSVNKQQQNDESITAKDRGSNSAESKQLSGRESANGKQTDRTVGNGRELKYKSTQLDLPQEEAKRITDFSKIIPQDKLSPEEKTIEPHTTVLFGMDNEVQRLHIEPIIKNIPPVTVELGKTSLFKNDKYDVLKIDVKSPALTALNEKLAKNFTTPGQTFTDYKPHVTIAYLKKGEGDLYSGLSLFEGKKITINHLTLSDGNGGRQKIPLSGIGEARENGEAKTTNAISENGRGVTRGESRVGESAQPQRNAVQEKNNTSTSLENNSSKMGESGGEKNIIPEENNHSSVTLNSGVNPGLDKFFNEDIKPAAITLGQAGKESFDVVNPPLATEAARKSADLVRKALATIDNFRGITQGKYQKYASFFNNHSDKQNVENISNYERTGQFKIEPSSRKGDPNYSTLYHDSMIESYKTIAAAYGKDEEGFIENYVRRQFTFPNETEAKKGTAVLTNFARSLSGNKSVLKQRVLEMPLDEALQNMQERKINVKMASSNPEELRQWSLINAKKLVVFRDTWNQLKAGKLIAFVRRSANSPDGMIKLDDRAAKVFAPAEVYIGDSEKGFKTVFETGSYYADPSVARILNNAISSGAEGSKLFRAARVVENAMGSMQLGISAFHFTGTGINAGVSDFSLGLRNVLEGKSIDAVINITRGVIPGASLVRDVYLGTKLLNGLKENNPEAMAVLDKYFNPAGARLTRDQRYELGALKGMYSAFQNGNIIGAGIRIPHALVDVFSYHLMTKIIPRAKATAFLDLAKNMDRRLPPDATAEQRQRAYTQAWASIDNRFGQLVYDNLFWNKLGKDVALLVTRSVGWNLGTVRELGGGILVDPFKTTVAGKGKMSGKIGERVTDRTLYAVALIAGVALMGAMYQYLHTGQGPQELKDYFFPKDGGKDKNGNPTRKSLPSYVKDLYAYSQDWKGTILHKSSPIIDLITQFITNQDYQGNLITNKNDPIGTQLAQAGSHLLGTMFPFSVQQFTQGLQQGANPEQLLESFFGFVKAPAGVIQSDKQKALQQAYQDKFGTRGPMTPEQVQAQNLKNKARDEIAKNGWRNSQAFHELMNNGTLKTQAQRVAFIKSASLTSQQRMINRFPKAQRAQFKQAQ